MPQNVTYATMLVQLGSLSTLSLDSNEINYWQESRPTQVKVEIMKHASYGFQDIIIHLLD